MTASVRYPTYTLEEIPARRDELAAQASEILTRNADAGDLEGDDRAAFDAAAAELEYLKDREAKLRRIGDLVRAGSFERGSNGPGVTVTRDATPADAARRLVDASHTRGDLTDAAAEKVTRLLGTAPDSPVARWANATGSEHYRNAFAKIARDPQRGHLEWTAAEGDAFRQVAEIQRAMSISGSGGAAGGFLVPFELDPTILLTSDGSVNPLRQIARVEQIVSSAWNGITSAGVSAEWKTEGSTAADASPTVAQAAVPVHLGDAFVPFSFEVGQDAAGQNLVRYLQPLLTDAADQLQAAAYVNGTGSGQPDGVLHGLGSGQKVPAGTADTIAAADVVAVQNALPPRFQARARWCANLSTINAVSSIETSNGALRFPEVADGRLLRKPIYEVSPIPSVGDADPASVLLYGDFTQFLIVDRIGTTMEFVQNLLDPVSGRPTGQRGALLWFRTGSAVLVPNAFRVLTVEHGS